MSEGHKLVKILKDVSEDDLIGDGIYAWSRAKETRLEKTRATSWSWLGLGVKKKGKRGAGRRGWNET